MFILITGIFSKKNQDIKRILSGYIVPYAIFDSIYVLWCLVVGKESYLLIIIPTYVYWYILCIAIQKMMLSYIKFKSVIFLIVLGIQIGTIFVSEEIWRVLSIGRVVLLFPIFYIGYLIPMEKLHEMRNKKLISLIIGFVSLCTNMILYKIQIVPISGTHDYYTSLAELGIKYIYMITTFGLFISLNALLPENNKVLSRWGRNSLIVYLMHPFFVDVVGHFVRHSVDSDILSAVICIVVSVFITSVLSLDIFRRLYDLCIGKINKALRLVR